MGPTSLLLQILLAGLALAAIIAVIAGWRRIGRSVTLRLIAFVGTLALALATIGVGLNRQYALYTTWGDLFGTASHELKATSASAGSLDKVAERAAGGQVRSVVIPVTITGKSSQITLPGQVYVPAAYLDPANKGKQFPVIEVLNPYPGSPDFYTGYLQLPAVADQEIAAGRMPPALIVIPQQNPVPGKDSECVNEVRGHQVDTYLTTDLREFMVSSFRVRTIRHAWSTIGYSTGGYCAVNLTLRHPDLYIAAASFSGMLTVPPPDGATGDLFKGHEQTKRENDPLWTIKHKDLPPLYFWLYTATDDPDAMRTSSAFAAAVKPPVEAKLITTKSGGHGPGNTKTLLPAALGWLGNHMVGPLAPPQEPHLTG